MRPWRPPPGSPKKDPPPRERRAGAHGQHDAIHPGPHQAHTAGPDPPEQTCADGPPPITEATQPPMPSEEEGESQDQNRSQSRRNQGPRTCWPVALPGPPDREGGTQVGGVRAPPPADSPERSTRGEGSRGANLTWTPGTRGNRKPTASRGEGAREGRREPYLSKQKLSFCLSPHGYWRWRSTSQRYSSQRGKVLLPLLNLAVLFVLLLD